MRTRNSRLVLAGAAVVATLALSLPAVAAATTSMQVGVKLTPYRLGKPTHITFNVKNVTSDGSLPVPVNQIIGLIGAPASAINTRGFPTCSTAALTAKGPSGCPRGSLAGSGSAQVGALLGATLINETASLKAFLAPNKPGNLATLNVYGSGTTPIAEQLVFPLYVQRGSGRYGIKLVSDVPPIPTVPGGPNASTISFSLTLGGSHRARVMQRVRVGHRTVRRRVTIVQTGITLPRACPRGGFQGIGQETFADGSSASTHVTVRCP